LTSSQEKSRPALQRLLGREHARLHAHVVAQRALHQLIDVDQDVDRTPLRPCDVVAHAPDQLGKA
jgi:hypothetical protein